MMVDEVNREGEQSVGQESRIHAAEAAARGEAWACIEAIVRGPLFDGLTRRLLRFEHVDAALAYDLFASALDQLHAEVSQGSQIRDPIAWVRRVALNQASDLEAGRRREVEYVPELDHRGFDNASCDGVSRDVLRQEALRQGWKLVDQIQQTKPRLVVRLILEAIESGRPDGMPAAEIAERLGMTRAAVHTARTRGLQALIGLIEAEGHQLTLDFARRLEEELIPMTLSREDINDQD